MVRCKLELQAYFSMFFFKKVLNSFLYSDKGKQKGIELTGARRLQMTLMRIHLFLTVYMHLIKLTHILHLKKVDRALYSNLMVCPSTGQQIIWQEKKRKKFRYYVDRMK